MGAPQCVQGRTPRMESRLQSLGPAEAVSTLPCSTLRASRRPFQKHANIVCKTTKSWYIPNVRDLFFDKPRSFAEGIPRGLRPRTGGGMLAARAASLPQRTINFGTRSLLRSATYRGQASQNSTLQNSLAVQSCGHRGLLAHIFPLFRRPVRPSNHGAPHAIRPSS
jgi:hypothetical protein